MRKVSIGPEWTCDDDDDDDEEEEEEEEDEEDYDDENQHDDPVCNGCNDSDDDFGSGKTVQRPYPPDLLRALQASLFCPCHGRYLENNPKVYWQRPQTRGHECP